MKIGVKRALKNFLPPIALEYHRARSKKYRWCGNYKNWHEAKADSTGYDSDIILQKTKASLLKVKNAGSAHERDSVLSDTVEYSYPVLAALMWIAANNGGGLSIIDFGGSLGSSYFQNRLFLRTIKEVCWNVVEQRHFVECGKRCFEDGRLRFYETIEDCLKVQAANAILFSGVIQYLEKPYELLSSAINKNFEYMIFDRTSFNRRSKDKLVIQKVDPAIYDASYPCWFLDVGKFKEIIAGKYNLISEFVGFDNGDDLRGPIFKGFIYRSRKF